MSAIGLGGGGGGVQWHYCFGHQNLHKIQIFIEKKKMKFLFSQNSCWQIKWNFEFNQSIGFKFVNIIPPIIIKPNRLTIYIRQRWIFFFLHKKNFCCCCCSHHYYYLPPYKFRDWPPPPPPPSNYHIYSFATSIQNAFFSIWQMNEWMKNLYTQCRRKKVIFLFRCIIQNKLIGSYEIIHFFHLVLVF